MIITTKKFTKDSLRGLGASLSLPLLDSMMPHLLKKRILNKRLVVFMCPMAIIAIEVGPQFGRRRFRDYTYHEAYGSV